MTDLTSPSGAAPAQAASGKTGAGVPLSDLVTWLDTYLDTARFDDASLNGLQIEGGAAVRRVAASVDSSLHNIEAAVAAGADILLTHHGLFWGRPLAVTGPHMRRVKAALDGGLSLYTSHLPLDYHREVGNNAMMAKALSLENVSGFGHGDIGLMGTLPRELGLQDFADRIQKLTGEICLVHSGGHPFVHRVGICSGEGSDLIPEAKARGLDTLLTGEPAHKHFHDAFEYGVNVVYAGHYETEVFGVRALAAKVEEQFGLPWQFLHQPTGL